MKPVLQIIAYKKYYITYFETIYSNKDGKAQN